MRHGRWGVGLWFLLQIFSIFEAFIQMCTYYFDKTFKGLGKCNDETV